MIGLSIAHLNVRGLTSKIDEVKYLLFKHDFKIFCTSETFLGSRNSSAFYDITDYRIVRRDRGFNNGGGLLCYLHKSVNFKVVSTIDCHSVECIILKIMPTGSKPFLVSFVYRPPSSPVSWENEFCNVLSQCESISEEVVIMGDFNINLLDQKQKAKWNNRICKPYSLSQLITKATRVVENCSSLIDHVYSTRPNILIESDIINCSLSDHDIIYTIRKLGVQRAKVREKITFVDYSRFTPENISLVFSDVRWDNLLYHSTSDVMVEKFNQQLLSLVSQLVSVKSRFVKSKELPVWLDKEVQNEIKKRENLKKNGEWKDYKIQRNFVTNLIKKKKKQSIGQLIKTSKPGDSRKLWSVLNVKSKKGSSLETPLTAEELNNHFSSIADNLTRGFPDSIQRLPPYEGRQMSEFPKFTPHDVIRYLSSIPDKKATGKDGISVAMLKKTLPFTLNVLTDILNRLLCDGVFPSCWKSARVTPIFKGGSVEDPSDFRPISILPVLSKLFEKHINLHLLSHMTENKILADTQTGFRKGFCCTDIVHKIVSICQHSKSKNETTTMIFLDFRKAFDCVDHTLLIKKLKHNGCDMKALKVIISFLDHRTQSVKLNSDESTLKPVLTGVPQGSILAPTLFLLFINDLLKLPTVSRSFAYADDTVFVTSDADVRALESNCNNDLQLIDNWCKSNKMPINMEKSHFLHHNSRADNSLALKIDNCGLKQQHETRLLGMMINDTLTWDTHVDHLSNKITTTINLLQLCRPFLNGRTAITFYYQFIFCHLIYGIHIYYNLAPKYVSDSIFLLQKRAFRIIANIQHIPFHLISTSDLSSSLNLLTLPFLSKHFTSVSGYRIFHGLSPKYFSDSFRDSVKKDFNLRDNLKLHPNNITMLDNAIASTFNNIPLHIRSSLNVKLFKTHSKRFYSTFS